MTIKHLMLASLLACGVAACGGQKDKGDGEEKAATRSTGPQASLTPAPFEALWSLSPTAILQEADRDPASVDAYENYGLDLERPLRPGGPAVWGERSVSRRPGPLAGI